MTLIKQNKQTKAKPKLTVVFFYVCYVRRLDGYGEFHKKQKDLDSGTPSGTPVRQTLYPTYVQI